MELMYLLIFLGLYIAPGTVANMRGTENEAQVWVVNIFLGWTFLGWVVALVMAMSPKIKEKGVEARPNPNARL